MKERLKNLFKGQTAAAILYTLMGLCLIVMPVTSVYVICKVIFGLMLIAGGLYHIWIYMREKEHAAILDLFSGGILLVFGGFLFFNPQIVVKLLPVLFGVFVLVDSIWAFQSAFRLKKRARAEWKILVIVSVIFLGLGGALIVNPFTEVKYTAVFAGWVTLTNGLSDLVFLFLFRRGMKAVGSQGEEPKVREKEEPVSEEPAIEAAKSQEEKTMAVKTPEKEILESPAVKEAAAADQATGMEPQKPVYQEEEEPVTSLGEVLQKKVEDVEEVLEEWVDRD